MTIAMDDLCRVQMIGILEYLSHQYLKLILLRIEEICAFLLQYVSLMIKKRSDNFNYYLQMSQGFQVFPWKVLGQGDDNPESFVL